MRAGPADESGWYKWKLVPSQVTAADLDALEKQIGLPLPGLVRTFLSACYHDFRDTELGRQLPDKPFASILNAWNPALVRAGFLPFGWDNGGAYLRCIDLANMPDEDRCPLMEIDHEVLFDLEEFPYYLLSARQMAEAGGGLRRWIAPFIRREYKDIPVDETITRDLETLRWLPFAVCRNDGGSSRLFLDFSPSESGKSGQVVRWLHDPDQLAVIADSFDGYLELLMENEYDFVLGDD